MNNTFKALNIDEIYCLIKPFSELGEKAKKDFDKFKAGSEKEATIYYQQLSIMLKQVNKSPEQINLIGSILSHFEDIRSIVNAVRERALEMHEIYQIKHFIYFYRNLFSQIKNSSNIIKNIDFEVLYDLLDIDGQNSPTFYLSEKYSEKFAALKIKFTDIMSEISQKMTEYTEKIIKELNITKFEETVTISQKNQTLLNKLIDSKYFYISDENFANITLKLKKTDVILALEKESVEIDKELEIEAQNIRNILSQTIFEFSDKLQNALIDISYFDLLFSKAIFAKNYNCVIPEIILQVTNDKRQVTNDLVGTHLCCPPSIVKSEISATEFVGTHLCCPPSMVKSEISATEFVGTHLCCPPSMMKSEISATERTSAFPTALNLTNSFNILLKTELSKKDIKYQNINLNIHNKVNIITGSNMGGKSTILKTIGQIAMMTKLGLPLPAEKVSIRLFDNVFFSGPATAEDRSDLSSFGMEVFALQNVLQTKGQNLFLLDEFGRGTNPAEGQALFHSVLKYFSNHTETILISATHFSLPTDIQNLSHFQMIGLKKDYINELKSNPNLSLIEKLKLINKYMNYQPIEVEKNEDIPKSALLIAEILGLEKEIVASALVRSAP